MLFCGLPRNYFDGRLVLRVSDWNGDIIILGYSYFKKRQRTKLLGCTTHLISVSQIFRNLDLAHAAGPYGLS